MPHEEKRGLTPFQFLASAFLRRNPLKGLPETGVLHEIDRMVFDNRAGGIVSQPIIIFPVFRWPDGPRHKPAATIGTNIFKLIGTCGAKRALVSTDACLEGFRGQRGVAVFAGRPQLQHGRILLYPRINSAQKSLMAGC